MTRATGEVAASSAIYQTRTYQPNKSVSYLMHRVRRVQMLSTMDAELAADEHLGKPGVTAALI